MAMAMADRKLIGIDHSGLPRAASLSDAEHDLNLVASFVATPVILDEFFT